MRVVGEDVGQPDERGVAVDLVGVVTLDRVGDRLRQAPAAGQHTADDGVVDAELAALARMRSSGVRASRWTESG